MNKELEQKIREEVLTTYLNWQKNKLKELGTLSRSELQELYRDYEFDIEQYLASLTDNEEKGQE